MSDLYDVARGGLRQQQPHHCSPPRADCAKCQIVDSIRAARDAEVNICEAIALACRRTAEIRAAEGSGPLRPENFEAVADLVEELYEEVASIGT